jgi:hypothetical protein
METVTSGFDRGDLACTAVLLKAKYHAGAMRLPLAVELLPEPLRDIGWMKEAERYLSAALQAKQEQRPLNPRKNVAVLTQRQWENLTEEFGYDRPGK